MSKGKSIYVFLSFHIYVSFIRHMSNVFFLKSFRRNDAFFKKRIFSAEEVFFFYLAASWDSLP